MRAESVPHARALPRALWVGLRAWGVDAMSSVVVVDCATGNLHSVCKALEHVGASQVRISADPAVIAAADRVVVPGQGAIGSWAAVLHERGLDRVLRTVAISRPFLGICLGLQILYEHSAEDGGTAGLGLLPGRVLGFAGEAMRDPDHGRRLKIPHMGWNEVRQIRPHPLWQGIADGERFYFVHSYYAAGNSSDATVGTTHYGVEVVSAAARGNLFAVQFHPEKSQKAGLTLLRNFLTWRGEP